MPIEGVAEVAIEIAGQAVAEVAPDIVHRRFGWKGCVVALLIVAGLIALAIFLLA
jgi:sugar phosphate permease